MSPLLVDAVDPHRGQLKCRLWADPVDPVSCSPLYFLCGLRLMPCWNKAALDRVFILTPGFKSTRRQTCSVPNSWRTETRRPTRKHPDLVV